MNGDAAGKLVNRVANSMTSFDEVFTASSYTQFDLKSVYPLSVLRDIVSTAGGGMVTQGSGEYSVQTDTTGASEASLRSVERARYIAGHDGLAGIAVRVEGMPTGNQEIEWGNTDFVNGLAIGVDADGMFVRLYSGGEVVEEQRRSAWINARTDTLNPEKTTIYRIQYRWYGAGPYRVAISGVEPSGRGVALPVTTVLGNTSDGPITLDPNQPVMVRARNLGTTGNPLDVRVMGRQYFVMGDYRPDRRVIGDFRLAQSVGTTFVPLVSFRPRLGVYRSISRKLSGVSITSAGADIIWQVHVFGSLSGGSWASPRNTDSGAESALEVNTTATSITGGIQIFGGDFVISGQGNASSASSIDLPSLGMPSEETSDIVTLAARSTSGTATVNSVFRLAEEW